MTLTDILPAALELPVWDKIELIRALAEKLKLDDELSLLNPNRTYYVYSPYAAHGAARAMAKALRESDDESGYTSSVTSET